MKLALVADVHLGNAKRHGGDVERSLNRRAREGLAVLRRAYELAHGQGCSMLAVLGDLFDTSGPGPQLVGEAVRIIHEARVNLAVSTLLLVGNHDQQSDEPGDHALAPFAPLHEDASVVGEPGVMNIGPADLVMVPHSAAAPSPERLKAVLGSLPRTPGRKRVLLMHVGVSDDKTPPFLRGSHDSVEARTLLAMMAEAGVGTCVAGNWHSYGEWRSNDALAIQCGALIPTGWDNPGLEGYGGVTILDITFDGLSAKTVMLEGPRFLSVRGLGDLKKALAPEMQAEHRRLYVKATVDPADLNEAGKVIQRAHEKSYIAAGEVAVESADRVVEARKAASAARNADTLSAALDRYVSEMPLDEGVERAVVLGKCREYLKANVP